MDKFRKKLARKYNELYRIALFLGNDELGKKAENTMRIIRHNNDLEILPEFEKEIKEFRDIVEKPNKFDPFGQKELTLLATI